MRAYERLLCYAAVNTASDDRMEERTPSTECQKDLAAILYEEMKEIGVSDVWLDEEHAYVYGKIPASKGCESCTPIAFLAHLDVVRDFGDGDVHPVVIPEYDGKPIRLGESGRILDPSVYCRSHDLKGKTIICTDGTTILGADDKAGIAEIMTLAEQLIHGTEPHGPVSIAFVPDEEIGHGASLLDLSRLGAKYAYTLDGSCPEGMEYETFNAARASWRVTGNNVHPGSAKGIMINAARVAMEIDFMLPPHEVPEETCGYEGFYHLIHMEGSVAEASLDYILRDHDAEKFAARKAEMKEIENAINEKYGAGTAAVIVKDQYRNMAEVVSEFPEVIEKAKAGYREAGLEPVSEPVRGGTDGARLSFRGLPCPNLGTGGYAFHGPYEFAVAEQMDQAVKNIACIVKQYCS